MVGRVNRQSEVLNSELCLAECYVKFFYPYFFPVTFNQLKHLLLGRNFLFLKIAQTTYFLGVQSLPPNRYVLRFFLGNFRKLATKNTTKLDKFFKSLRFFKNIIVTIWWYALYFDNGPFGPFGNIFQLKYIVKSVYGTFLKDSILYKKDEDTSDVLYRISGYTGISRLHFLKCFFALL